MRMRSSRWAIGHGTEVRRPASADRGSEPIVGGTPWSVRVLLAVVAGLLIAYAAHALFVVGGHGLDSLFQKWVNDAIVMGAAAACLLRAVRVRQERLAWLLLTLGLMSWAVGNLYYSIWLIQLDPLPVPSIADLLWLGTYPPTYIALGLLLRSRIASWGAGMWLDGVIAATAVASVSAAIVLASVVDAGGYTSTAALLTNIAYPVCDLILLGMALAALAFAGWRVDRMWGCLVVGFVAFTLTDGAFLYQTANGTYQVGTIVDAGWLVAAVLVSVAAWQPINATRAVGLEGRRVIIMPAVFGAVAVTLDLWDHFQTANTFAVLLSCVTLVAVIARMVLALQEAVDRLKRRTVEAHTDALTGLANRRRLIEDLEQASATAGDGGVVLGLFDLNGFKRYNDTFGHPAGDALLADVATKLGHAASPGHAYRMGGDEFCVLIPCERGEGSRLVAACAAALTVQGDGFSISAAFGCAELPTDAQDPTSALHVADQDMYAAKHRSRLTPSQETTSALSQVIVEHSHPLDGHAKTVAALADHVASHLGLPDDEVADIVRAAELHDIGKIAIPDRILEKPAGLTPSEWELMRRHAEVGQRIIQAAPSLHRIGDLVRSTHERWDGTGYPDQLEASEIPLGARIIAVCDAFDAMTHTRPYQAGIANTDALEELTRCARTQFDPQVVAALKTVLSTHATLRAA